MPATTVPGYTGLNRIEYPARSVACYRVKILRQGALFQQYFPYNKYGGKAAAFAEAKRCWLEMRRAFPPMSRREMSEVERRKSPSGIVGVARITKLSKGHKYSFWRANFTDPRGRKKVRIFSVRKYGNAEAKKRALQARKNALAALT